MLTNDRPIMSRDEDRFGFASTSDQIVSLCTGDMDAREGATIGLTGPWGSGKTSCLNIARERLKERGITVVEFNPWLRANTEAIVIGLVSEVAKAIGESKGRELKKLAKRYERTIKALTSTALPVFGPVLGALTTDLLEGEESPEETKRKLVEELRSEHGDEKPVVVVIDDIDRLEAEPLRELLRAVRLVADLPNRWVFKRS